MPTDYLDGTRLRRALIAGCDFVQQRRAELNRINVFPVPDGDTGSNLALTAAAIADELRGGQEERLDLVSSEAAEAAILGARGNCGMILSHYLLGFADAVRNRDRVDAADLAQAMTAAAEHVYRSLERPVEGTIITIMREVAEEARRARTRDFGDLVELLLLRARDACRRTPDMLPALRAAGVVDAGALGFVHILEGMAGTRTAIRSVRSSRRLYSMTSPLLSHVSIIRRRTKCTDSAPKRWCAGAVCRKETRCGRSCASAATR